MQNKNELQKKLDNLSDEDNKFISNYVRCVKSNLWADEIELPSGKLLVGFTIESKDGSFAKAYDIKENRNV